jgi:hypothetical protein
MRLFSRGYNLYSVRDALYYVVYHAYFLLGVPVSDKQVLAQLRKDVDLAGHLAIRARVFLDIWWIYEGAPTRGKYLRTMNHYSEFYRLEPHAHEVSMVMYLS